MLNKQFLLLALILSSASFSAHADGKKSLTWQIKNKTWNKSYEKSYEEFIATLGKGKKAGFCHTTGDCLKNPKANPRYYNLNPEGLSDVYADCADLPYILRAYFSWMNDLPFTYPVNLTPAPIKSPETPALLAELERLNQELEKASFLKKPMIKSQIKSLRKKIYGDKDTDIRYNRFGNTLVQKRYVKNGDNINTVLEAVSNSISTASFRTDGSFNETGALFRDTYPIAINRNAVKPGTILYDPNGHIVVVYEVTTNGKIHLIDAHPDNSLTAITYGEKFSQTTVEIGGGFSNWRPFSIETGSVVAASNEELPDYSLEQFEKNKKYLFNNNEMDFYEYVRNKLSVGNLEYNPVIELSEMLEEICHDVKERVSSVDAAIKSGISSQNHPERLPDNIYGTDGDWESYSTPSRDARLKASIREGRALMVKMIEGYKNADSTIKYSGNDLIADLKKTYTQKSRECSFEIKRTNGAVKAFNLDHVLKNIFKLSFDPYHCIELRWGLLDAESLQSCNTSKEKMDWYQAEQGLRNTIDRNYALKMDYTLKELPSAPISRVKEENISIEDALKD